MFCSKKIIPFISTHPIKRLSLFLFLYYFSLVFSPALAVTNIPSQAWNRDINAGGYTDGAPVGGFGAGTLTWDFAGDFFLSRLNIASAPNTSNNPAYPIDFNCHFYMFQQPAGQSAVVEMLNASTLGSGEATYSSLFPKSWVSYSGTTFPLPATVTQFSPIMPQTVLSNALTLSSYPEGIYEWDVTNTQAVSCVFAVMLTFDNSFSGTNAAVTTSGGNVGLVLTRNTGNATNPSQGEFTLATQSNAGVSVTYQSASSVSTLQTVFSSTGLLNNTVGNNNLGAIAFNVNLAPGQSVKIPIVVAWDIPLAQPGSGPVWYREYTRTYGQSGLNSGAIAFDALNHYPAWESAIDSWQSGVLNGNYPAWLKQMLFNELYYYFTGGTLWEAGQVGNSSYNAGPDMFSSLESYVYDYYGTSDVRFYGSWPLAMMWPSIDKQEVEQFCDSVVVSPSQTLPRPPALGTCAHDFGDVNGVFQEWNAYNYLNTNLWRDLNSKLVLMVYRDWELTGKTDTAFLNYCWPAVQTAMAYVHSQCDASGLPYINPSDANGGQDSTYDQIGLSGDTAYCGSLFLAACEGAASMANSEGNSSQAAAYQTWLTTGQTGFATLWNGSYYNIDNGSSDTAQNRIMSDQLGGQWYAKALGLPGIVPDANADYAWQAVHDNNWNKFDGGAHGAVNVMTSSGAIDTSWFQSQEAWVGVDWGLVAGMVQQGMSNQATDIGNSLYNSIWNLGQLWFRTPEAWQTGLSNVRAPYYMRANAIWAVKNAYDTYINPCGNATCTPLFSLTPTLSPTPTTTFTPTPTLTATLTATSTSTPTITVTFTPSPTTTPTAAINWYEATGTAAFQGRNGQSSVVYNGLMWVIGGFANAFKNDVWSSPDGVNWTQVTANAAFSGRYFHSSFVFNNKMWVIGGWNGGSLLNDVWYSTDGANWTQATANAAFSPRENHTSLVYNNLMWVIGGGGISSQKFNDVWSSPDGVNWTEATASAAFSPRWGHGSVVFNNLMWVIAGFARPDKNDVWYSSDGANWTEATAAAAFPARDSHTCLNYGNQMWVIAGENTNTLNDVWSSPDGVNWTSQTLAAQFAPRAQQSSVVYNNQMWVIAGSLLDDVWYSPQNPTMTPTLTATSTPTVTNTSTPTATFSHSPTVTSTATPTYTSSFTVTSSPTPFLTVFPTNTPTLSVTFTRTIFPTPATATYTPTLSLTFTKTIFPTPGSPTHTATHTSSPTLTRTNTITPTNTRSPTPSPTATTNFTSGFTATADPSDTLTSTPTITSTNTPSVTSSFTSTSDPSDTPTNTPTFTSTNTPTVTATVTSSFTSTPDPSDTPTNTPTFISTNTPTDTTTFTSILTATSDPSDTPTYTSTSTYSNTPTITMTLTSGFTSTPDPSDTPTSTPTSTSSNTPTVTVTMTSTFTSTPDPSDTPSSSPTATSSYTLTVTTTFTSSFTATPDPSDTSTNTVIPTNSPTDTASSTMSFTGTPDPSDTPTSTPTSTSTNTPTATDTVTSSFTSTPDPSDTPTSTPSSTSTNTPTVTATLTSSFTSTPDPSDTPSSTPTSTTTNTLTATSSSTPTWTWTLTGTATPSNTQTATPTFTSTNSFTFTETNTPTATATATSSSTPTSTFTFTRTSTPTLTATFTTIATPSRTPTATGTATRTSTPNGTSTRTGTPTNTPTVNTPTKTSTVTFTLTSTRTATGPATPTLTPVNTATKTGTPTTTPTVNTPTKTFTITFTATKTGTPTITPTVQLTFYPTPFKTITVSDSASACVSVGQSLSVTAVFGPTNEQNQTDDYSIGFGNGTTIVWGNGCTSSFNTGSLSSSKPVTVVQSVSVPATLTSGYYTGLYVVGIQDSTYLCGGSTVVGSTPLTVCAAIGKLRLNGEGAVTDTPTTSFETAERIVPAPNLSRNGEPIRFRVTLDQPSKISLTLFSLAGERIYSADTQGPAGLNTLIWGLTNLQSQTVASGLYLYQVTIDDGLRKFDRIGKVVVLH